MSETRIYLDNAATTKISDNVLDAMLPWLKDGYGNASSVYSLGRKSAIALNKARAQCAEILGCESRDIFFTSGGTESDNQAVFSAAERGAAKGKRHIIASAFEHHAVLEPLKALEKRGFRITYLPVYENGIVRVSDVEKSLTDDTALVTVMAANNEIGTIQPISEIGALCRERGVIFHTDAVQAFGNIPINVREMNIDMLSLSGHKIHAMKGTGLLYARNSAELRPFILGGAQQSGKRAGTENIAGIVGLAEAVRAAAESIAGKNGKLLPLRDKLISEISKISGARLNGDREKRLASNVNFSFAGIEGEALILQLDLLGIAVSSGSACTSGSLEPSHVLTAIGLDSSEARSSVRITMSSYTTEAEIDELIRVLPGVVEKLRALTG
ncbi:MAG: IscS subfamily cysteine desulfurase [Ruminiclostridium sp.]|nr:IscS subfamily cysteine desulfurase [Ruminiclostridium sp.]